MVTKEKLLHGVPETADALGIDQKTLRKMLEEGNAPGIRTGRNWKIPLWWIRQQREGVPAAARRREP